MALEGEASVKGGRRQAGGPLGGLQVRANALRRWRWNRAGRLLSAPVRCRREQWYLARGFPRGQGPDGAVDLLLQFLHDDETIGRRRVPLSRLTDAADGAALLGWVQAPASATHLQVCFPGPGAAPLDRLMLHPVADCDAVGHPLANVPRWSAYQPPFPIRRVVLPEPLAPLAAHLPGCDLEPIAPPRSLRDLAARAAGAACVIDPGWVRRLGLTLADLERIAAASWVIVDLGTFAGLVDRCGAAQTRVATLRAEHEIMAARVAFADVPTRGLALQDVVPYATVTADAQFQTRVLRATGTWKRYAAGAAFHTLLASQTPWEDKCGDVLSALRRIDRGALLITDLPWLVAGCCGPLLAPRLARHLLRMHLAGALSDGAQYWCPSADCTALVRDIADMPQWFPPLRAVRWSAAGGVARLGIALPATDGRGRGQALLICTGRIDQRDSHDGMPAEPMVIFMKWLAREARQRTAWAERFLAGRTVIWQFDSAEGLKYALHYESAAGVVPERPARTLILRPGRQKNADAGPPSASPLEVMQLPDSVGVLGDASVEYQAELTRRLSRWIEQAAAQRAAGPRRRSGSGAHCAGAGDRSGSRCSRRRARHGGDGGQPADVSSLGARLAPR